MYLHFPWTSLGCWDYGGFCCREPYAIGKTCLSFWVCVSITFHSGSRSTWLSSLTISITSSLGFPSHTPKFGTSLLSTSHNTDFNRVDGQRAMDATPFVWLPTTRCNIWSYLFNLCCSISYSESPGYLHGQKATDIAWCGYHAEKIGSNVVSWKPTPIWRLRCCKD